MKPGEYRTRAGSSLVVSGRYGGTFEVSFDWLEEGGCCDCVPEPIPEDGRLVWRCEWCGGGASEWMEVEPWD